MSKPPRLRVEPIAGGQVVRFLDRQLFDDRTVRDVSDQLLTVANELGEGEVLLLDCSTLQATSSMMLGRLILVHRRLEAAGRRLALCDLSENLAAVLRSSNLDRYFHVYRDRAEFGEETRDAAHS